MGSAPTAGRPYPVRAHASPTSPRPSRSGTRDAAAAVAGGLGVVDGDRAVTGEGEAGHAAQCAGPLARVVPQVTLLDREPGDPDRQLVAHAHRLVTARGPRRVGGRGQHPGRDLPVRLAPGRPERVT